MTTFPDDGRPGIHDPIIIDDREFDVNPGSIEPLVELLQFPFAVADGGAKLFRPYRGTDQPLQARRYAFRIPFPAMDGDDLEFLEEVAADGRNHTLCLWRREKYVYAPPAGQSLFRLPRRRRNAGRYFGVSATWPIRFTVNGVERPVTYQPTVAIGDPVPAGAVWASDADFSTMVTPAVDGDSTVIVECVPLYLVVVSQYQKIYPGTVTESADVVFEEL